MTDTGIIYRDTNRDSNHDAESAGWNEDPWAAEANRVDWADMSEEPTPVNDDNDGFSVVKSRRDRKLSRRPPPARTSGYPKISVAPRPPNNNWRKANTDQRIDDFDICSFNELCPNLKCPKTHCVNRDVSKIIVDVNRKYCLFALNGVDCRFRECRMVHDVTCSMGGSCTVGGCILRHPDGHNPSSIECSEGLECVDAKCVGRHPDGWVIPLCEFSPFCLRVGKGCDKRHDPLNGTYRMIHKICNYKTNGMECRHTQPCPYLDPAQYKCKEGVNCKYAKLRQCGFSHAV